MKKTSLDNNDISAKDMMKLLLEFINAGEVKDLKDLRQLRQDAKFMTLMLEEEIMMHPEYIRKVDAEECVNTSFSL